MTEDESRAWQRGANSDTSQRQFGVPGKRPPSPTGGRGRGRGRAGAPYYVETGKSGQQGQGKDVKIFSFSISKATWC